MGKFFLLSLILFGSLARAHGGVCSDLLMGPQVTKLVQLVNQLNPQLLETDTPTMEQLYLALKAEDQRYRGKAIPTELELYLKEEFASKFKLESNEVATQFYVNFLYSFETRVADLWRIQEVRAQTGSMLSPELESFATHLLDSFFSPNALNDKALKVEDASELFQKKPWLNFPWTKAIGAVAKFFKEKPNAGTHEFARGYKGDLTWNEVNRISVALGRQRRPGVCCLSKPGCTRCPLNRRFRNRKD